MGQPPGWDRQVDTRESEDRYDWERARLPISAFGETKTLNEWFRDERCTITRESLRIRLAMGWDAERAISAAKSDQSLPPITHAGRTLTLRGWADLTGIRYRTLYRRLYQEGMDFASAVDAGPQRTAPVVPVTAFGETKALTRWAIDERAAVSASTIRTRIANGWDPERAIREPPSTPTPTRGTGPSYTAFGRSMPVMAWAEISGQPDELIRKRMDSHRTMETALQSLGWIPPWEADAPQVLQVAPESLRPGDLVVSAANPRLITVRRLPDPDPDATEAQRNQRTRAARSRRALPGAANEKPVGRDDWTAAPQPAAPRSARPTRVTPLAMSGRTR